MHRKATGGGPGEQRFLEPNIAFKKQQQVYNLLMVLSTFFGFKFGMMVSIEI